MKKSFLILGVLASICATDAYARTSNKVSKNTQTATETYLTCGEGCVRISTPKKEGDLYCIECYPAATTDISTCPAMACARLSDNPIQKDFVANTAIDGSRPTPPRSAKIMVPQKVVYKEITFDDSVDEIEE